MTMRRRLTGMTVGLAVGAAMLYRYDREQKKVAGALKLASEGH